MSQSIVLKSFAELADALNLDTFPAAPSPDIDGQSCPSTTSLYEPTDLATLLEELEAASATLATVARQDHEARKLALRDLEQYDALVSGQRDAEDVAGRAQLVRCEAEHLAECAFAQETREAAARVAGMAAQAEAAATQLAQELEREAETIAAQVDIERLLAARQREEETEKAKAAEAEMARRLSGALTEARAALRDGRVEEAKAVLEPLAKENSSNGEIASLMAIITQRELTVKVDAAEEALWLARREWRHAPAAATEQLTALDVDGLPEPLARQIFGEWARAVARLCRVRNLIEPLRYAPDPGRGAVIVRDGSTGDFTVVSALGMPAGWTAGSIVTERQVRRARPLR